MTRRAHPRGFTLVELLVVLVVTIIGFVALLRLQIGTLHSAGASRDAQSAVNLAEHVAESMRIEALQWIPSSGPLSSFTTFRYLKYAPTDLTENATSGWLKAFPPDDGGQDRYVSPVGNDAAYDSGAMGEFSGADGPFNADYCVHYRLTWVIPDLLLRADVRVMWLRDDAAWGDYRECPLDMAERLHHVSSVTTPIPILRNVFVRQVGG